MDLAEKRLKGEKSMNCNKCGNPIADNAAFCEFCGQTVAQTPEAPAKKPENVFTGIVGALIGAMIGGGCIILLSQLGYVAALSGFILAVCTLKGYELLGGQLTKKGIIISIVLMLITPYIADRLDWAIVIMNAWSDVGVTFGEAFAVVPMLIEEGSIAMSDYIRNLLMIYGFALLGAFSTLRSTLKKK